MDIRRLVARRTDLSTFLVHLTRSSGGEDADDRLESILQTQTIEARTMLGAAKVALENRGVELNSQKCVCFTETPLEYIHLLVEHIDGRAIQFARYGIAFTKRLGRQQGVNPVWYLDITPGHDWLTVPVNNLVTAAVDAGTFAGSPIERLASFIEQMGTQAGNYRKEFWWEREWRHQGDFDLPSQVLIYETASRGGSPRRAVGRRWPAHPLPSCSQNSPADSPSLTLRLHRLRQSRWSRSIAPALLCARCRSAPTRLL